MRLGFSVATVLVIALQLPLVSNSQVASKSETVIGAAGKGESKSLRSRSISFPASGLGEYYLSNSTQDVDDSFMPIWPERKKRSSAKGAVSVPADAYVALQTGWGSSCDIKLLSNLHADDIQSLCLSGSVVSHENLHAVCGLTGLKHLNLSATPIGSADLKQIASKLHQIESLELSFTQIGEDASDSLLSFRKLRVLSVCRDPLGDGFFARLSHAKSLQYLDASETSINNAGCKSFVHYPALTTLKLSETSVSDQGLVDLSSCKTIKRLDLSGSKITDVGVKESLSKMPNLEELNLTKTSVTDAGVLALKRLPKLRKLWLRELVGVTDKSVPVLGGFSSLKDLEVQKTSITKQGVITLGNTLPDSEVHSKSPCSCRKRVRVN
ncbi:MAG TPA: hypothetical protein V6C97_18295 [Oculatellaceae cyanobacterium]